jgi:hypothetical protein
MAIIQHMNRYAMLRERNCVFTFNKEIHRPATEMTALSNVMCSIFFSFKHKHWALKIGCDVQKLSSVLNERQKVMSI